MLVLQEKVLFLAIIIINSLLTKLVWSTWLDIGSFFFAPLLTSTSPCSIKPEKRAWPVSSNLDLVLGQFAT